MSTSDDTIDRQALMDVMLADHIRRQILAKPTSAALAEKRRLHMGNNVVVFDYLIDQAGLGERCLPPVSSRLLVMAQFPNSYRLF